MTPSETCGRCGEEVRFGWRHGITGWWHRGNVDHFATLGRPVSDEEWQAALDAVRSHHESEEQADEVAHEVPAPEVRARPIEIGDDLLPQGAKNLLNHCRKHGWSAWATYSRGPVMHGSLGTFLRIADCVVLRARLDEGRRVAVACWQTDPKGKYGMEFAYRGTRGKQGTEFEKTNTAGLRAWIKGES